MAARRLGASHEGARAHANFQGGMIKSNLVARCFGLILLVVAFVWVMNSSSAAQSGRKPAPGQSPQTVTQYPKDSDKEPEKRSTRPLADNTPVEVDAN